MAMPPPLPPRPYWRDPDLDELDDFEDDEPLPPQRHKLATTSLTLSIIALVAGVLGMAVTFMLVAEGEPIPEEGQEGDEILAVIGLMMMGSIGGALVSAGMSITALVQMGKASPPQTGKGAIIAGGIISALVILWWVIFFGVLAPMGEGL